MTVFDFVHGSRLHVISCCEFHYQNSLREKGNNHGKFNLQGLFRSTKTIVKKQNKNKKQYQSTCRGHIYYPAKCLKKTYKVSRFNYGPWRHHNIGNEMLNYSVQLVRNLPHFVRLSVHCEVIKASSCVYLYLFWYQWIEETRSYPLIPNLTSWRLYGKSMGLRQPTR